MGEYKKKEYCEEHPAIKLIAVREEDGIVSKRCVMCDMEKHITTECKSGDGCTKDSSFHDGAQCVWGDVEHHVSQCDVGCPLYKSEHSVDADGHCNKGCC